MAKTIEDFDGYELLTTDNDGVPLPALSGDGGSILQKNFKLIRDRFGAATADSISTEAKAVQRSEDIAEIDEAKIELGETLLTVTGTYIGPLPRTGQTTSYATGDDGYFQAGNQRTPRFIDNGDGTASDLTTGLMWVKDVTDCGETFYTGGVLVAMSWSDALAACNDLSYGGFTDWRLPNIFELFTLSDWSQNPAIASIFSDTVANTYYWASTTYRGNPGYVLNVRFQSNASTVTFTTVATTYYVRPVRGGNLSI